MLWGGRVAKRLGSNESDKCHTTDTGKCLRTKTESPELTCIFLQSLDSWKKIRKIPYLIGSKRQWLKDAVEIFQHHY